MLKTKNKQKKRNTKQFKKQLNKKTNKMNNQNNKEIEENLIIFYESEMTLNIDGKDLNLKVKDGNQNTLNKYSLGLVDIEEHLNQKLYFQFYCEKIDFNYTVMYDNSKGFQFQNYLNTDEKIVGREIGPNTLYGQIERVFNDIEKDGKVSDRNLLLTDMILTLYVKYFIIPNLNLISKSIKSVIKPPINLFSNTPNGSSDYMVRLQHKPDGKIRLSMESEELSTYNLINKVNI